MRTLPQDDFTSLVLMSTIFALVLEASSLASSSARPHEQFLHARFLAPGTGVHEASRTILLVFVVLPAKEHTVLWRNPIAGLKETILIDEVVGDKGLGSRRRRRLRHVLATLEVEPEGRAHLVGRLARRQLRRRLVLDHWKTNALSHRQTGSHQRIRPT